MEKNIYFVIANAAILWYYMFTFIGFKTLLPLFNILNYLTAHAISYLFKIAQHLGKSISLFRK